MDFSFLSKYWAYFNYGVLVTIMISACVVFFGTIIGVLVALIKRSRIKVLDWLVSFLRVDFSWYSYGCANYDFFCPFTFYQYANC